MKFVHYGIYIRAPRGPHSVLDVLSTIARQTMDCGGCHFIISPRGQLHKVIAVLALVASTAQRPV